MNGLLPEWILTIPCHVTVYSESVGRYGQPETLVDVETKCHYQDYPTEKKGSQTVTAEVNGSCYFNGDLFPQLPAITKGKVNIFGNERDIISSEKGRDLYGNVKFTRLLIK